MATKTKRKRSKKTNHSKSSYKKGPMLLLAVFSLLLIAIIAISVISSHHKPESKPLLNIDKEVCEGIDVSYHNGTIKWDKVSQDVDFAIIRVAYRGYANGELATDTKAKQNLKNANKYGVPVGVYVFTQAINEKEARQEAKYALKIVKDYDISLPIFIDYEYATDKKGKTVGRLHEAKLGSKESTNIINAFCKTVTDAGYTAGVYASSSMYKYLFYPSLFSKDTVIWVADYNESVTYNGSYDIWQYTSKGKMDGVKSKYVDKNYLYLK